MASTGASMRRSSPFVSWSFRYVSTFLISSASWARFLSSQKTAGVLVSRARRHFPAYRAVGALHTLAIVLHKRRLPRLPRPRPAVDIVSGRDVALDEVANFLRLQGARKQFAPVYRVADFGGAPATRGFDSDDFLVARQGGRIVGLLGLWSQSAYKQTVVDAYGASLARLRPLYNLGARILRQLDHGPDRDQKFPWRSMYTNIITSA